MRHFEVQHTLRLYDSDLVSGIAKMFDGSRHRYSNKNEFITEMLKCGYEQMKGCITKANVPNFLDEPLLTPQQSCKSSELAESIAQLSKYIATQFKTMYVNYHITERLLSCIYNIVKGMNSEERVANEKAEDGFYDDLPTRFDKIILRLEKIYSIGK